MKNLEKVILQPDAQNKIYVDKSFDVIFIAKDSVSNAVSMQKTNVQLLTTDILSKTRQDKIDAAITAKLAELNA